MYKLFKRYFVNFWIWWYVIQNKELLKKGLSFWMYTMGFFKIVPMLTNLFVPLYQDETRMGRVIAFPIRFIWVIVGSLLQIAITIPLLANYLLYLALPLIPIWNVTSYYIL